MKKNSRQRIMDLLETYEDRDFSLERAKYLSRNYSSNDLIV